MRRASTPSPLDASSPVARGRSRPPPTPLPPTAAGVVCAEVDGAFTELGRTRHRDNDPDPVWPPLELSVPAGAERLRLQIYDHEGAFKPIRLIGQATEELNALLASRGAELPLRLATAQGKGCRSALFVAAAAAGATTGVGREW